jgi:hypothetical protein
MEEPSECRITKSLVRSPSHGRMSGGPSPDDFRAQVFPDREHVGDWRVKKLCDDGESTEITIFSGGDARLRAIRYADREYGTFDEIELEPYQRSALADPPRRSR